MGRVGVVAVAVVVVLVGFETGAGQILNTLRGFDPVGVGWSGELASFFGASGGNTENVSLTGSGRVQWQGERHRMRLMGDATHTTSGGTVTEETSVVHVRLNRRLGEAFATILFVQHQHDEFQRLTSRFLSGVGARWDWIRRERLEGSWGVTPMLEVERIEGDSARTNGRLSTFVSVLGRIDDRTTVDVTTFVQPRLDDASDLRAVGTASLRVALAERLSLVVQGSVQYDRRPAETVEKADWKTRTGISVRL
jgi:hypothetical protein